MGSVLVTLILLLPGLIRLGWRQGDLPPAPIGQIEGVPGPPLRHDPTYRPVRVPPPKRAELGAQSVSINVVYNPGSCSGTTSPWPATAQAAFAYATGIWASLLTSGQPIVVHACWRSDLGPGILGSAGPNDFYIDGSPSRAYPVALANSLNNTDLNGAAHEINASFSSNFNWYFGTNGSTPANQVDFVTVVLHELGHGLGFTGSMDVSGNQGSWGYGSGIPAIYDSFAEDGNGTSLLNLGPYPNPSTQLATALTGGIGGVLFDGNFANTANNNAPVPLYAPGIWNDGSSFSHLDTNTFAGGTHGLMVHQLSNGAAIHDPGAITLGLFQDMGWTVSQDSDLSLTKSAPITVEGGQALTYTLVVRNGGVETAANIVITDMVPLNSNLDANSLSGGASATGTTPGSLITWTTGQSLTTNETLTRTFVVTVNTGLANGSAITNTGSISATNLAAVGSSNTVASTVAAPALSASLASIPNPILTTTTTISYILTIQNSGDAAATGVVITNTIPSSTTYLAGSASHGAGEAAPGVLVWPPTAINANSSINRTYRVNVTAALNDGDQLVHIVSATSLEGVQIQNQALEQTVGLKTTYLPLLLRNN